MFTTILWQRGEEKAVFYRPERQLLSGEKGKVVAVELLRLFMLGPFETIYCYNTKTWGAWEQRSLLSLAICLGTRKF